MNSEKQRSTLTATRHGLSGQVVVLPGQDLEAYKAFSSAILESFGPKDAHEAQLAQCYAGFQWRINRVAAIEDSMFTLGLMEEVAENLNIENAEVHNAASNAKTFRRNAHAFDRLSMYNQRLINGAAKVLKQLEHLQAERRKREQQQLTEATRAYQYHQMLKTPFDPRQNGFDLSLGQIQSYIGRTNLHKLAQIAEDVEFDDSKFHQRVAKTAA